MAPADPPLIRKLLSGNNDPGALAHLVRLAGMFLLVGAIVFRPHNYETAAFPPPPDMLEAEAGG